jgi:hypothetical protein
MSSGVMAGLLANCDCLRACLVSCVLFDRFHGALNWPSTADYFRRRNCQSIPSPPKPASASVEGSGTGSTVT